MLSLWTRLPIVVRAIRTGGLVAAAGTPWAALVSANSKHAPSIPWAVPPTALYLWLFWRYVRGAGPPRSTSDARRTNCRANRLSDEVWGAALLAGTLTLGALVLFQRVMSRLVMLPQQPTDDLAHVPPVTLAIWLLMSAAVAGIAEESSFRGYMLRPIERRHGPVVAILVTGSLFGFVHFTHPEVTLVLMPYYLGAAAIYGALAYFTDSILPSAVLHAAGNIFSAIALFTGGRAEWQASATPAPLIWETDADASEPPRSGRTPPSPASHAMYGRRPSPTRSGPSRPAPCYDHGEGIPRRLHVRDQRPHHNGSRAMRRAALHPRNADSSRGCSGSTRKRFEFCAGHR